MEPKPMSHPPLPCKQFFSLPPFIYSDHSSREKPMTPFESLLWNIWLPKVRTSINNEWSPDLPQQAVKLYEVWSSFLPPFIRDNLLDQLILPKVQKAVADWNSKNAKVSLQAIVFPWLPYLGLRLEDVVGDARRKVKNLLRSWVVDEEILSDLAAWKDVRLLLLFFNILNSQYRFFLKKITGFRYQGMGYYAPQIRCTETWSFITKRLPCQSSRPKNGTTSTRFRLVKYHSTLYILPDFRNRVFPKMVGHPPYMAHPTSSKFRRSCTMVFVLERIVP